MTDLHASVGRDVTRKRADVGISRGLPGRLRFMVFLYRVIWIVGFPFVLGYFFWRTLRDRRYGANFGDRFGGGKSLTGCVWIHAVSLGEIRAAESLIRALLDRGDPVVVTCMTPAAREEAERRFGKDISIGRFVVRYQPFEFEFAYRRLFRQVSPKFLLVMEFDIWPVMIIASRKRGIPVYLCNSQITTRNLERSKRSSWSAHALRLGVLRLARAAFAKSDLHATRFRNLGVSNVSVTGELRFDQPLPEGQISMARQFAESQGIGLPSRLVIALSSVVEGEDELFTELIVRLRSRCQEAQLSRPIFVYVPRRPERFAWVAGFLHRSGLTVVSRSKVLDDELHLAGSGENFCDVDVFFGDSLGEMPFYLEISDIVIVGGGFTRAGAHNVIESLALKKPVMVGPHIWTIEFPAAEAMAAGVLFKAESIDDLENKIMDMVRSVENVDNIGQNASRFHARHAGSVARTLAAIDLVHAEITAENGND